MQCEPWLPCVTFLLASSSQPGPEPPEPGHWLVSHSGKSVDGRAVPEEPGQSYRRREMSGVWQSLPVRPRSMARDNVLTVGL